MDAAALVGQARRRGAVQLADAFPLVDAAAGAGDPGHGVTAFQHSTKDSLRRSRAFYEPWFVIDTRVESEEFILLTIDERWGISEETIRKSSTNIIGYRC